MAEAVSAAELARTAAEEVGRLDQELAEIDLLAQQAHGEAAKHEAKRAQLHERLSQLTTSRATSPDEVREVADALIAATRRATLMDAQVDVLRGKQRVLERFRDRLRFYADALTGGAAASPDPAGSGAMGGRGGGRAGHEAGAGRAIQDAQEDLRRDIARAMHDGPAQSLTNIALQAQIVQRLVPPDSARAASEVAQLVAMVQQTLEATKTFIFDVRPMVLDDLGLVPTLRRTARDRSRTARLPVEFDSVGPDRRLGPDLESAVFRMIDDAISGYLATTPARVAVRLEWTEAGMRSEVRGVRSEAALMTLAAGEALAAMADEERAAGAGADVPPALAGMIQAQRDGATAAAAAAHQAALAAGALPADTWRAIAARAKGIGVDADLSADGALLVLDVPYPDRPSGVQG